MASLWKPPFGTIIFKSVWRDCHTYRGVQVAFIVHGQVELGLDTLYSHHSQPNGDEVENSCEVTVQNRIEPMGKKSVGMVVFKHVTCSEPTIAIIFLFCTIDGPISLEL